MSLSLPPDKRPVFNLDFEDERNRADAFDDGADAAMVHCLRQVREFYTEWLVVRHSSADVLQRNKAHFQETWDVSWHDGFGVCFGALLRKEGVVL